jgi:hypothetical protein
MTDGRKRNGDVGRSRNARDSSPRGARGEIAGRMARAFHAAGKALDRIGVVLVIVGISGCGGHELTPCDAWKATRAAACLVCRAPDCGSAAGSDNDR